MGTAAVRCPATTRGEDSDARVLGISLILLWPAAAMLPILLGLRPLIALPWITAVAGASLRSTLYATPPLQRSARRARLGANPLGRLLPWSLTATCAAVVLAESLHLAYSRWVPEPPHAVELWEEYARRGHLHALTVLALVAGVVPLMEEFAFRGLLMGRLEKRFGFAPALVASAVIFAVLHASRWALVQLFVVGLVLGAQAWGARSVWASVITHAVWNAFAFAERFWTHGEEVVFASLGAWTLAGICLTAGAILVGVVRHMRVAPTAAQKRQDRRNRPRDP